MKKKRKKRRRYKIKNILMLIIVIFLIIELITVLLNSNKNKENTIVKKDKQTINKSTTNESTSNEPTTYLNNASKTDNFDGEIDEKIQDIIVKYMDSYFKSITTLKEIDMTNLFCDDAYEEAYINQTAISLLINSRKLERNKMTISNAKYDIVFDDINKRNCLITVKILENDYLHFDFMKGIESKAYGIENTFVLKEVGDTYKIKSLRKVQDFYVMITNEYEVGKSDENAKNELDKMKENYISDFKDEVSDFKTYLNRYENKEDTITKTCDYKYDRTKALNYAKKYVTESNSEWSNYSEYGGNCQNFASQVIYNGGVPMDLQGDAIWKYYGDTLSETKSKIGRSTSWTGVTFFYDYAKANKGYGLCAEVDINPFYAEAGDIGQVGYNNIYKHTVVIIGNVKNNNGKITDLLINSNSINLENYPLSGYVYPDKRVIKILGWNKD